ncbi:hypothetical protein AB0G15_39445 [Streptosporangium sp. NPDC023825]|uniref:hypothetical protein n=1 Tax=Streptosporangium sp. NPDC023825 TaxID=3154909 RepID=UPI0034326E0F
MPCPTKRTIVIYSDQTDNGPRNLLGEFPRARREATGPAQAGFLHAPSSRTPGPRREEVAMLAGISASSSIRLEQGPERDPSPRCWAP